MTTDLHWQNFQTAQTDRRVFNVDYMKKIRANMKFETYKLLTRLFECEEYTPEADQKFNRALISFLTAYNNLKEGQQQLVFEDRVAAQLELSPHKCASLFSKISKWRFYLFKLPGTSEPQDRINFILEDLSAQIVQEG